MKDKNKNIAIASFIKGIGSIFDSTPISKRKSIKNMHLESDVESLRNDWYSVGKDINGAIKKHGRCSEKNKT